MARKIYINPDDDINTVIAEVVSDKEKEIELVVPSGARILQNIVDAYLLKDAVSENAKSITIITNDLMGKIFAERAGIKVTNAQGQEANFFVSEAMAKMADIIPRKNSTVTRIQRGASSQKKQQSAKTTKRARLKKTTATKQTKAIKRSTRAESRFLRAYKEERARNNVFGDLKNIKQNNRKRRTFWRLSTPKVVVVVLLFAVVVAGLVFGRALPKAEAIIYPVREPASFNIEVLIDQSESSVDLGKGILPGEVLTREASASQKFSSTGIEDVTRKARGTIKIFNEFSSQPQAFIPSRFQAEDGKIFWTTTNITVPGAVVEDGKTTPGSVEVEVIAAEAGEAYNIGVSQFRMPALNGTERYDKIYAVSTEPMKGGLIGQAVVVSEGDLENAYNTLRGKVSPEINKLRTELPKEFLLWPETYNEEIADKFSDRELREPAETFEASMKIVARAVVFKKADLEALLNQEIQSRLSEDQTILPKSKEFSFLKPPVVDYQRGSVFATLQVRVDIIDNLNTNTFRGAILNKDKSEIKRILANFTGIERVEVKLWPFWVKRVPKNIERVEVSIFGL